MSADEFDARLERAVQSLVTEPIHPETAREAAAFAISASRMVPAVALASVVVILGVAAVAASNLASGHATPGAAAVVPSVVTADGRVSAQRSGDRVELVLDKPGEAPLVLASLVEAQPSEADSYISVHATDCPPATGLAPRYYVFGQVTNSPGPIVLQGATGIASSENDLYVIALTSDPTTNDWSFRIGGVNGGGGEAGSFDRLDLVGDPTPAGCFVAP